MAQYQLRMIFNLKIQTGSNVFTRIFILVRTKYHIVTFSDISNRSEDYRSHYEV